MPPRILPALVLCILTAPWATAQDLSEYLWVKRPLVIFADTPNNPHFKRQLELLEDDPQALIDRDVEILTDTDPQTLSPLREKLRPRGFVLVLVGKDGKVKLRKPRPWTVREISRAIDNFPLRIDELRAQRGK